jgi:L-threonylcarbamoyladenylate synthase
MTEVSLLQMAEQLAAKPTLVSFPTDTVPAVAALPEYAELIYQAKRRPPEKPLILMGACLEDLLPYVCGDAAALAAWKELAAQHWPGQLTLVLPASDRTPPNLNPLNTGTLGIRVPNHPIALDLLARTGPLATTSANLSGQPPLTDFAEIAQTFPTALTLCAEVFYNYRAKDSRAKDSKQGASSGTPSTVVKWTGHDWQLLRQGEIRL